MPVQTVDENDVDGRFGVIVDAGYLEALDLVEGSFGSLVAMDVSPCLACREFASCTRLGTSTTGRCSFVSKMEKEMVDLPYLSAVTRHHATLDL